MQRPSRFEHNEFVGDKRKQIVHDIDVCDAAAVINELMAAETYLCFGPDTLAEARNRGYRQCAQCPGVQAAQAGRLAASTLTGRSPRAISL